MKHESILYNGTTYNNKIVIVIKKYYNGILKMTKPKSCDCELCLLKQISTTNNVLNNNILTDKHKIIESIIYHFIFRIGSLIKSKKEINTRVIDFINSINEEYNLSNDSTKINTTINKYYQH